MLGSDLARKVLLLVGFGRIGQAVATRALGCGDATCDTSTCETTFLPLPGSVGSPDWPRACASADFVSLHVDLNPCTRNLMGPAEFASMKPTAFFVNTSRGGVVDQTGTGIGVDERADRRRRASTFSMMSRLTRTIPILGAPNVHHRSPHRIGHERDPRGHGAVRRRQSAAGSAW